MELHKFFSCLLKPCPTPRCCQEGGDKVRWGRPNLACSVSRTLSLSCQGSLPHRSQVELAWGGVTVHPLTLVDGQKATRRTSPHTRRTPPFADPFPLLYIRGPVSGTTRPSAPP